MSSLKKSFSSKTFEGDFFKQLDGGRFKHIPDFCPNSYELGKGLTWFLGFFEGDGI